MYMAETLILSCLKVFFCRICDVTFGSIRTVFVVKGKTVLAALFGFFEVFIWFLIVKDALSTSGPVIAIALAYALGFACGTFIGGSIAKKLTGGHVTIHVVTSERNEDLCHALRSAGFGITVLDVNGSEFGDEKYLILADFSNTVYEKFENIVKAIDPGAFLLVQETKDYSGGYRRPGK